MRDRDKVINTCNEFATSIDHTYPYSTYFIMHICYKNLLQPINERNVKKWPQAIARVHLNKCTHIQWNI